jgi:WD40 repeat protein
MAPTGDMVATASWDSTCKLYSFNTDSVVCTLGDCETGEEGKMGGLYCVAFAKTVDNIIGCASADKHIYLWNFQTGRLVSKLLGHNDEVNGVDFHSSQTVMCSSSDDCKALIWDHQEGITLRTLDKHTKAVYGCKFLGAENQYWVATCCFDQKVRVFDMRDRTLAAQLNKHTDDIIGIDYSSRQQTLATGSDDGFICLWDVRSWKLGGMINTREDPGIPDNEVKRVAFSQDGNFLAAACSSQQVLVYDLQGQTPKVVGRLDGHGDCVFDVTWGTNPQTGNKMLVSASHDHTCMFWSEDNMDQR